MIKINLLLNLHLSSKDSHIAYNESNNKLSIFLLINFILFFIISLLAHKYLVNFISNDKEYLGLFTDNRYSYSTFIHTYSLRFYDTIIHELAVEKSSIFIGTPEENNFSILKAILANPFQFFVNILYNLKEGFNGIWPSFICPILSLFFYWLFIL